MKVETELTIISGFVGFSLGVCIMMVININKEHIDDCEDMIEWMKEDVFNGGDSTIYYIYIPKLENIADHNRNLLYTTTWQYDESQYEHDYQ